MKSKIGCSAFMLAVCMTAGFVQAQENWPHWRGPHHNGISDSTSLPMKWSLTENIVWEHDKDTPYAPSGLLFDNKFYFLRSNNGNLSCLDAQLGKEYYSGQKLEGMGNVFASLVGAKDRVYVIGQKGTRYVIKHGPVFEVLARNKLDDNFSASPAIVGRTLYIRGYKYLYCIEEQ